MENQLNLPMLRIYFDGLCPLCSREINHYRQTKGSEKLIFIDITDSSFNPQKEGLDPLKVHHVLHVKDSNGNVYTAVDAFIHIWRLLPNYNWLAHIVSNPFIKILITPFYYLFAKFRPQLQKRNKDCQASPYCKKD